MRFNLIGFVMFLVGIGVGVGIARSVGSTGEGLPMVVGGPLLVLLDLGYRKARGGKMFGRAGGTIIYLPVWLWGAAWAALGVVYIARGH